MKRPRSTVCFGYLEALATFVPHQTMHSREHTLLLVKNISSILLIKLYLSTAEPHALLYNREGQLCICMQMCQVACALQAAVRNARRQCLQSKCSIQHAAGA